MAGQEPYFDPEIHCISLDSRKLDARLKNEHRNHRLVEVFSTKNSTNARSRIRSKLNAGLTRYDPYLEFSMYLGQGSVESHKKMVIKDLGKRAKTEELEYYAKEITKGKTQWVWADIDKLEDWSDKAKHGYNVIQVLRNHARKRNIYEN